jgi:FtsP/CotA-like multicopper oxidase with cupredoxin domain
MKKQIYIRGLLFSVVLLSLSPVLRAQTFDNPIPIPYLMQGNSFSIDIGTAMHNFDPNGTIDSINLNVPLEAYCYNQTGSTGMTYLGPTLIFNKGEVLDFDITNNLPPSVNTTVHWHGLNIPAQMDGGPHQVILNGGNWTPGFTVIDPVQTIWYHTHLMDATTDQVIRGLAGMIIVEDSNDPLWTQLPHDYGENDFPIVIQEKNFILDRSTSPPLATEIKAGEKPGNGPYTLVNGVVGGVLRVPPEMVRLRVLNGSPRKMFHIGLSSQLNSPGSFETMWMIATGGGYVDVPRPTDSTLMSIGDRREFLVDFSGFNNGDTIYMSNLAVPKDANYGATPGEALMAFVVDSSIIPSNSIVTMPATLEPYALDPGSVFKVREKELIGQPNPPGNGQIWTIDGTPMKMDVINDTVLVNTKERWIIHNTTSQAHPFHIHKVQFQVIEYDGLLGANDTAGVYTYPDLPDELFGYKDVQLIRAGATLIFEARFDSFPSPLHYSEGFMYHCHILTHEDTSMMHQFVVVDSTGFTTGISSVREQETLFVYPNPAESKLYFTGSFSGRGTLLFYDTFGRILRKEDVQLKTGSSIDVQDLPRGLVLMEFISGEDRFLQKLILH